MSLRVEPLTPTIGARVTGLDLSAPLDDAQVGAVRAAWLEHQVLHFPEADISLDEQKVFAARFGELFLHPTLKHVDGHPEVVRIRRNPARAVAPGEGWHTDMPAAERPPAGSMLRLERVPATGGDTMFCSMYAAYEALSDHMQRFLEPLHAWQSGIKRHGGTFGIPGDHPEALHPVVRTHPETGRKALYVNQGFTTKIDGLPAAESNAVLNFLYRHCENPAFHMRLSWTANSMTLWDNRCVMHNAINDYPAEDRLGYRVMLTGDRPT